MDWTPCFLVFLFSFTTNYVYGCPLNWEFMPHLKGYFLSDVWLWKRKKLGSRARRLEEHQQLRNSWKSQSKNPSTISGCGHPSRQPRLRSTRCRRQNKNHPHHRPTTSRKNRCRREGCHLTACLSPKSARCNSNEIKSILSIRQC